MFVDHKEAIDILSKAMYSLITLMKQRLAMLTNANAESMVRQLCEVEEAASTVLIQGDTEQVLALADKLSQLFEKFIELNPPLQSVELISKPLKA